MQRKGPGKVLTLSGKTFNPGSVSQAELRYVAKLQAVAWQASDAAIATRDRLKDKIQSGASVEPGDLRFDAELGMVRTRKEKRA